MIVIVIVVVLLSAAIAAVVYAKHVALRRTVAQQSGAGNHLIVFSPPVMDGAGPPPSAAATRRRPKTLTGRQPDRRASHRASYRMQTKRTAPVAPERSVHLGAAQKRGTNAAETCGGFDQQPLYLAPVASPSSPAGNRQTAYLAPYDTYKVPVAGGNAQRESYATPAALDLDLDDDEGSFGGFDDDDFGTMTTSGHAVEQFEGFGFDDASPSGTPGRRGSAISFESAEYDAGLEMGFGGDVYAQPMDYIGSGDEDIYASPSGDFADPQGWANVHAWVALGGGGPGRQEAEEILGNDSLPLGSYLVRSPQPNGGVTLSVKRYATQVLHFRIVADAEGMFSLQDSGPESGQFFADVVAVLRAHTFEEGDPRADRAAVPLAGCIDVSRWIAGVSATSTL